MFLQHKFENSALVCHLFSFYCIFMALSFSCLFLSILLNVLILFTCNLYYEFSWSYTKSFCTSSLLYSFTPTLYFFTLEPAGPICRFVQDLPTHQDLTTGVYFCLCPALVWWGEDGWTDVRSCCPCVVGSSTYGRKHILQSTQIFTVFRESASNLW